MKNLLLLVFFICSSAFGQGWERLYSVEQKGCAGVFVEQTSDKGYIITGGIWGTNPYTEDILCIKTSENGDTLWQKAFGGTGNEWGYEGHQTADGGYIIVGFTASFGVSSDIYLIKLNGDGDTLWTRTYGSQVGESGYSVQETSDGSFFIVGCKFSTPNS